MLPVAALHPGPHCTLLSLYKLVILPPAPSLPGGFSDQPALTLTYP